jgi:hypothetical protein
MKRTLCVCALAVVLAGCAADPYVAVSSSGAKPATVKSIQAMGGLDNWKSVHRIHATAVVTDYVDGTGVISQQQHEYDLDAGTLTASGELPQGLWKATVHLDGRGAFADSTAKAVTPEQRFRLVSSMLASLRRAYGTLRLSGFGPSPHERATSFGTATIFGTEYIRIGVAGGVEGVKAFYLDTQSYLPVYVTVGVDQAGGVGRIARYQWTMLNNGLAFPATIEVYDIGQDVLVGHKPVLEVDLRDITAVAGR